MCCQTTVIMELEGKLLKTFKQRIFSAKLFSLQQQVKVVLFFWWDLFAKFKCFNKNNHFGVCLLHWRFQKPHKLIRFSQICNNLRELPNQQICLGKAKFVDESYFLQKENVFRKPLYSNCCQSVYFLQNKGGGVHLFCGRNKYFCKICINRIILTRFPRLRKKLDFQYSKRNSVIFFAQNMRQWYFVDAKFPRCVKSFEGSLLYSFDKSFNWNLFIICLTSSLSRKYNSPKNLFAFPLPSWRTSHKCCKQKRHKITTWLLCLLLFENLLNTSLLLKIITSSEISLVRWDLKLFHVSMLTRWTNHAINFLLQQYLPQAPKIISLGCELLSQIKLFVGQGLTAENQCFWLMTCFLVVSFSVGVQAYSGATKLHEGGSRRSARMYGNRPVTP